MHAPMLMAYPFIYAGQANLIGDPYITSNSDWQNSSSGSTFTYGVTDEEGGSRAARVTLATVDNHQVWWDLPSALTEGQAYDLDVYFKQGPAGFTGDAQMAYYDGGNSVNSTEVTTTASWALYNYRFVAGDAPLADPSIRLIGFSNGADGDEMDIGEVVLTLIEDPETQPELLTDTTINSGDSWSLASGLTPTYNVSDSQGGTTATRLTLSGADNHHMDQPLSGGALTEGEPYTITVTMQEGPAGFTGGFQIAYYDDGSEVNSVDVTVPATWDTIEFTFIAGAAVTTPEIRLIGFSNGSDGDEVEIEQVHLVQGSNPA